ncbi:biotin transporter BioY [Caenispirillum bisanense]|uniref:biotin transporter BioY n=1 Tax=Caenispirillum bisanense TaxID=414052 RepID=UPI0031D86E2B
MPAAASVPACLASRLWPAAARPWWRTLVLTVVGVLLLVAASKVRVPAWPVPVTLQTLCVLLVAACYGCRLGMVTVGAYLALGAAGLPVFAGTPERGLGLSYMIGPTGGYLAGFLAAAALVGALADRGWDRRLFTAGLGMTAGIAVIIGLGWLRLSALVGWERALEVGVVPFVPAEAVKIALATCLLPLVWTLVGRASGRRRQG